MKSLRQFFLAAILVTLVVSVANAQTQSSAYSYRGWSVTLKGGVTKSLADIRTFDFAWAKSGDQNELKFMFGAAGTKMFNASFGIQANGWYGNLLGMALNDPPGDKKGNEDSLIAARLGFLEDVYYKTSIYGGALSLYLDFNSIAMQLNMANHKPKAARKIAFYGMIGFGLDFFDSEIRTIDNDSLYGQYLLGTTGTDKTTIETDWPLSVGFKYKISRSFDLGLEGTLHNMITDKLDAYTIDAAYRAALPINSELPTSSFKNFNDKYLTYCLALTYKFVGKDANTEYIEWKDPTDAMYDDIQMLNERMNKLSADVDNDGVSDFFDKEPTTPQGYKVYGSGESVDSDKDGVADGKDADLFSPKDCGVNGDGVPADGDGDGVPDCLDKEKNTAAGNMVNFQGVTIPKGGGDGKYALPTIFFDTDKSEIKAMYYPELANVASLMKQYPTMKIKVTGNCDERASDSYNQSLGQRRADAAKDFLVKYYGIDASRITTESKGESSPLYKPLFSINRRVDFTEVK